MKKLVTATAICIAATFLILPLTHAQGNAAPPAQISPAQAPPAQAPQDSKVFQGQITKVDATAKSLSLKGAGDAEMTFEYSDATQIVGSEKNVQEFAGKTGTELKVTYRDAAGKKTATKIETVAKK